MDWEDSFYWIAALGVLLFAGCMVMLVVTSIQEEDRAAFKEGARYGWDVGFTDNRQCEWRVTLEDIPSEGMWRAGCFHAVQQRTGR